MLDDGNADFSHLQTPVPPDDSEELGRVDSQPASVTTTIESIGATTLVQVDNTFHLYPSGGSSGPQLSIGGAPVVAGANGPWTPIAAEQTATGYQVAWKASGVDQYLVWATDSNGAYVSTLAGPASGGTTAIQSLEASFQQDLNSDGTTGLVTTIVETAGATDLARVADRFFLYAAGTTNGPQLSIGGAPVVAGANGPWTPFAAEATATGYEVAWKAAGVDQYLVWATDSSGAYVSTLAGPASGGTTAIQSRETSFQQDLNSDGTTGLTTTIVDTAGSTDLARVADHYFLYAAGTTNGPELSIGGTPVVAGTSGPWMPIGAEQTASGYEVAWKAAGLDQYLVWATNFSGAYISTLAGPASGGTTALQSLEASFQQDLNSDGTTGLTTTVIETAGSIDLAQVADHYFLYAAGTTTGPELSIGGAPVLAGQSGPWMPIAAEQSGGGYAVAWKAAGVDQYLVWAINASGVYTATLAGPASGGTTAIQSLETSFQQDLNSDGTTGLRTTIIETDGSIDLAQVADRYFLYAAGTTTGPELSIGGATVLAGLNGPWTPIGAEQTASGYEVAWKAAGLDQYLVWATNFSGAYTETLSGSVAGVTFALQSLEASFQQDLNSDGTAGLRTTIIETDGSTDLVQVADRFFLYAAGTTTGPQLTIGGAPVLAGVNGPWTPIGAEQTSSGGYDIAWKATGIDQYLVWAANSSGAYTAPLAGPASGSSIALRSLETGFQQDLNADTVIATATTVESFGATSLIQVLGTYFLGSTTAPQLSIGGSLVIAGQNGPWTPIGVEQFGGGYQVAWKASAPEQYLIWGTNGSGAYTTTVAGPVGSGSWAVQTRESTFQQDLNGDTRIGALVTPLETFGTTQLTKVADAYFLYPVGGSTGPMINVGGTAVVDGMFGGWTPFSAETMVGGYRVAWKMAGVDQYTVWNLDGNGSRIGDIGAVSGSSIALRSLERSLQQDLNGDSVIASATTIEASGGTSLVQVLGTYFLGSTAGAQLTLGGTAAIQGQFGPWTPVGAEQSGGGYEIILKRSSIEQYIVWSADGFGRVVGGSSIYFGQSSSFESFEPRFGQDLNGDGTIGVPASAFNIDVSYSGDAAYQSYFTAAAQRWQQVIVGDLQGFTVPGYGFVDDLFISASVTSIDGAGRILGRASPEYYRTATKQPITGFMEFDSADLAGMAANGTLLDVITHEMGHVLGIGTMWDLAGLKSGPFSYAGSNAVQAYRLLSENDSASVVPLETTGGSGTAGSHWSEAVFGNELMTGFIGGTPNPLSILTIGALRDLSYTVNYSAATPFSLTGHPQVGALTAGESAAAAVTAASAEGADGWQPTAIIGQDIALLWHDDDEDDDLMAA